MKRNIPIDEISIEDLYNSAEKRYYEVPIYQRNYAWGKDEVATLIQDVYDAYKKKKKVYFIGTLVSFYKGDNVYEIIDGQQRLTTIKLVLEAMQVHTSNVLTYRVRKKSDATIRSIPNFDVDEKDKGIEAGYKNAVSALRDLVEECELIGFITYFRNNVHIIHYRVPKDIDLNHYFEIMNSRGEQLEKHEIVKAQLLGRLSDSDGKRFNEIWEACSEMGTYIQQRFSHDELFIAANGMDSGFNANSFDEINVAGAAGDVKPLSINNILESGVTDNGEKGSTSKDDSFQPIIDFPNFLLIILKVTLLGEEGFNPLDFTLDDKELLNEFDKVKNRDAEFVKRFGYNLLKGKYFLDNFIVHHSKEEDTIDNNPWKLQCLCKDTKKKWYPKNIASNKDGNDIQDRLVNLLSMFEVSFTARQRKNYLFYCIEYLFSNTFDETKYYIFVKALSDKYFRNVYLVQSKLNAINTPMPGSFDETVLVDGTVNVESICNFDKQAFVSVYGDGSEISRGIPLFVFNYIDYKLWELYADLLKGENVKEGSPERRAFFDNLGCSDFGLDIFRGFYFSRTRRSLEHYYPQANAIGENGCLDEKQINCLGNFAMIGSEANSAGSNWSPKTKLDTYLDSSRKIKQISVASLKFMIMMQKCKDNLGTRESGMEWNFEDIVAHQDIMMNVLQG